MSVVVVVDAYVDVADTDGVGTTNDEFVTIAATVDDDDDVNSRSSSSVAVPRSWRFLRSSGPTSFGSLQQYQQIDPILFPGY